MFRALHHPSLWPSLVLFATNALAGPGPSEQDFLGELPVVLSISRLAQPQSEAPGSVTVIDSEFIRLSGAREVADLFRLVPGFQVGYSGSTPRVYYHGALDQFGQHMQVLVDGRSVYSPFFLGGVNWNTLPLALEDIERIEVLRGSNSAAYGSDSFLGVANIITRHPSQTPGWTVSRKGGGKGVEDNLLRFGGGDSTLSYRFTAGRRSDQGFDLVPSDRDMRHFNLRADWRANMRDEFQFQAGAVNTSGGAGYPGSAGDAPRLQGRASSFVQAKWQRTLSPEEDFHLAYFHTEERYVDNFLYQNPVFPGVMVDYGGTSARDDLEIQHRFSPRQDMRIVWGGGLRQDRVKSTALFGTGATLHMEMMRIFGNWEWRISPKLLLNFGTSSERNSLAGSSSTPRVMLSYHLTPDHTFRLGATRATRAPSIFEEKANLGFYFQGELATHSYRAQNDFQEERIVAKEIGYLGNFRSLGLTADVRLFRENLYGLQHSFVYNYPIPVGPATDNQIRNVIAATTGVPQTSPLFPRAYAALFPAISAAYGLGNDNYAKDFRNPDHPTIRGAEWQIEYRPASGTRLLLNQTFLRVSSEFLPSESNNAPTHSTSLALFQKLPMNMSFSGMIYSVGAMYWPGRAGTPITPSYRRADVRLAAPFQTGSAKGEAFVLAQGLGPNYYETDTFYQFQRRITAGVSINF